LQNIIAYVYFLKLIMLPGTLEPTWKNRNNAKLSTIAY